MALAVVAGHRKVRVAVTRQAHFPRSARASATAPGKHCRHCVIAIGQYQSLRSFGGAGSVALRRRRRAQELAVSGVAEIKFVMTSASRS